MDTYSPPDATPTVIDSAYGNPFFLIDRCGLILLIWTETTHQRIVECNSPEVIPSVVFSVVVDNRDE